MTNYTSLNVSTGISTEQMLRSLAIKVFGIATYITTMYRNTVFNSGLAAVSRELKATSNLLLATKNNSDKGQGRT